MNTISLEKRQEIVEFLKERSIFKVLDSRILEGISPVFTQLSFGPGHIVFRQGDPADALYIIQQGSVEVIQGNPPKNLAYLTAGDCFGEMALVHDTARNATIRVPESVTLIRLPKAALKELRARFPEVTSTLADVVNQRMAGSLPFQAPGLQGNLAFFDLATVMQTVVGSRQAGILVLFGPNGRVVAQLVVKDGAITYATFNQLSGERAVLELMTRTDPLDFIFERQNVDKRPCDDSLRMKPPHFLLIEGARRHDHLLMMFQNLGWPNTVLTTVKAVDDWKALGPDAEELGPRAWPLIGAGCTLEEITEKLPFERFAILSVIDVLLQRGHIQKLDSIPRTKTLNKTLQLPKEAIIEMAKHRQASQAAQPESRLRPVADPINLIHGPTQVVNLVNAINSVTSNLAVILGRNEVRYILTQALKKAAEMNPHLASIKIHPEAATLDVRYASPEFSSSITTIKSLELLTRTFIDIASKSQKAVE